MARKRAKGTRKTLTPNQREWQKIVQGIRQKIKRAEKRGYRFNNYQLPERPSRVTQKQLEKLKEERKNIYQKAIYITPYSGEIVEGIKGRKIERKKAARKAQRTKYVNKIVNEGMAEYERQKEYERELERDYNPPPISDTVLTWVEEQLDSWSAPEGTDSYQRYKYAHTRTLQLILGNEIARKGRDFVAENLEENSYTIKDDVSTILFDSNQTQVELAFNRFLEALYDRPLDLSESVEITDYAERASSYDDV